MATITRQKASLIPVAGNEFLVTGMTAGSKNSLVLTGFVPDFVVNGALTQALGTAGGSCSYDPSTSTFEKDPSDATQVLIDVYPVTVTSCLLWVW
jgi:hypothetical protein